MADNDNQATGTQVPDANDFTKFYNTQLSPPEQASYDAWEKDQSDKIGRDVHREMYDYDMQGYWRANIGDTDEGPQLGQGHLTDAFKKPNHPTFSDESQYHGVAGNVGGHWREIPTVQAEDGEPQYSFKPGATNLEHHGADGLRSYFDSVEKPHGNDVELPGPAPQVTPGGSSYLANQRARFGEEMQANPQLRGRLRAILSLENEGAGPGVPESLMNRMSMTGDRLEQGMGGGAGSFYGPVRKGLVEPRMRQIERDPAWRDRLDRSIDQALGGSNVIKGHTDQGSAGDPNYYTGGVGVNINGERFNHWGGYRGVDYSRQWTENQQRNVAEGGFGDMADDARSVAATRMRRAVRPEGGRREGAATDVATHIIPTMARGVVSSALAGPKAMEEVFAGDLDPTSPEGIAAARSIALGTVGRPAMKPSLGSGVALPGAKEVATEAAKQPIREPERRSRDEPRAAPPARLPDASEIKAPPKSGKRSRAADRA